MTTRPAVDSAIAPHLRCPRTLPRRCADDYVPFKPGFVAHFDAATERLAMVSFGVQYRGVEQAALAHAAIATWRAAARQDHGPAASDVAHYVDEAGFDTLLWIASWPDPVRLALWMQESGMQAWWNDPLREAEGVGWFRETVEPAIDRVETILSGVDAPEGIASFGKLHGPVQEKGYWGGMRDRLPVAQRDRLAPGGSPHVVQRQGKRLHVRAGDNLVLIRSGHDWSDTSGEERRVFLDELRPVLHDGMRFLQDEGQAIGCHANRLLTVVDENLAPTAHAFGMSWWHSLADLERWAETHPTHLAIYGGFLRMARALNFDLRLRLYHEVAVVPAQDQAFEYIACHPGTGLLRALA